MKKLSNLAPLSLVLMLGTAATASGQRVEHYAVGDESDSNCMRFRLVATPDHGQVAVFEFVTESVDGANVRALIVFPGGHEVVHKVLFEKLGDSNGPWAISSSFFPALRENLTMRRYDEVANNELKFSFWNTEEEKKARKSLTLRVRLEPYAKIKARYPNLPPMESSKGISWSPISRIEKQNVEQAGADQPATKPANKPAVKDQTSTPTSKDVPR